MQRNFLWLLMLGLGVSIAGIAFADCKSACDGNYNNCVSQCETASGSSQNSSSCKDFCMPVKKNCMEEEC